MAGGPLKQRPCGCKVGRGIQQFELEALNDELVQHRSETEMSFRDLATYTNKRILEAAITDTSQDLLDGNPSLFGALDDDEVVSAIYDALVDEDVPPDRRARVRTRLSQAGIDLDRVEDSWITHTTIRRHMQECLDLDTSVEQSIDTDQAQSTVEWITTRCHAIVARTFDRLQSAGNLDVGTLEVSVSIRATCTECGATYSPAELITRGRCKCNNGTNSQ